MSSIRPLIPILTASGILLAGNGLQGTLIALRGQSEGFSAGLIGVIGASYFAGFFFGCLVITQVLRSVGHIRAFAALAALAASGTLALVLFIDPIMWIAMRFVIGFCFAGLFTVMESWINSSVGNAVRGRATAVYRVVDLSATTLSQFMIPLFGTAGFTIFGVMAIMITLSLVPVSLGDRSNPKPPSEMRLDVRSVWLISPLACIGSAVAGLANSAFRLVGPLYAQDIGMSVADIATFMSLGIVGGVLLQYPLGSLSDRWDRRKVLVLTSVASMLTAGALAMSTQSGALVHFALILVFSSFAMPIYSLAAAHGNDNAGEDGYVKVAATLMFFYAIGAVIGPLASSFLMVQFGGRALFVYLVAVYAAFIAVTLYRMSVRPSPPREARGLYTSLLRTSPFFAKLAAREKPRADDEGKG